MSAVDGASFAGTVEHRHEPGRRIVSWGSRAAVAAPFVSLFGVAVGASMYGDDLSDVAASAQATVASATALATLVLLGLGLVAIYLRQEDALGAFGTSAFALAFVGTTLAAGGAWDRLFTVPYLAENAPAALTTETSGSLLAGFILSFTLLSIGWALFAIASRRAAILPRTASTVLFAGALLAFVPMPTSLRLLPLAIGAALLARAATAPIRRH